MADLSGVLRKTIDGLPRATPQMRAKVYEKARAAIQRQIQAANPPIAPEVAEARMNALEDAIDRTEAHYVDLESGAVQESDLGPQAAPPEPQTQPIAPETAPPVAAERPSPSDIAPPEPSHEPAPEPYVPDTPSGGPAMHSAWGAARDPEDEPAYAKPARDEPMADRPGDNWGASRGAHWDEESETREGAAAGPGWGADMQGSRGASEPPVFRPAEPDETSHAPVGVAGPFVPSSASAGAAMADYMTTGAPTNANSTATRRSRISSTRAMTTPIVTRRSRPPTSPRRAIRRLAAELPVGVRGLARPSASSRWSSSSPASARRPSSMATRLHPW